MFISSAFAQTAAATPSTTDSLMGFLPMIVVFVAMYFLMIRPQMKRAKDHKSMVDALQKGDEVITQGGIAGRISKVSDDYITVEIASNVEVTVQKQAIGMLLPKGTLKPL